MNQGIILMRQRVASIEQILHHFTGKNVIQSREKLPPEALTVT